MDEERLLAEIRANPDDDDPRAVYADLLTASGDPRGEYITLALALAAGRLSPEQEQRWFALRNQETTWGLELGLRTGAEWRRGFPDVLRCTGGEAVASRAAIRTLPIRGLYMQYAIELAELARMPELAHIESISLQGPHDEHVYDTGTEYKPLPLDEVDALCASPYLRSLRELRLLANAVGDAGAAAFGRAPWFPQLTRLVLEDCSMTGDGTEQLFGRPLPALRDLRISNTPIGERGAAAIVRGEFSVLARLELSHPIDAIRAAFGERLVIV